MPGKVVVIEKTLLLSGARQTEKTYIVRKFGKEYFEDANELFIIGAGSLLGVAISRNFINKKFSFPVGKIESLGIYPMNFEEFLIAM